MDICAGSDDDRTGKAEPDQSYFIGGGINPILLREIIFEGEITHLSFNQVGRHAPYVLENSDENPHSGGAHRDQPRNNPAGRQCHRLS